MILVTALAEYGIKEAYLSVNKDNPRRSLCSGISARASTMTTTPNTSPASGSRSPMPCRNPAATPAKTGHAASLGSSGPSDPRKDHHGGTWGCSVRCCWPARLRRVPRRGRSPRAVFSDKRDNYVPSIPDVWYAHRGLHDAGSGLTAQYAAESGEYVALARRMAMKAGYGTPECVGPIAPENSLAAFAAACEAGYGIELDIQLTMDGQVVVAHDETLMRVAGDPRRICDLTYDELTRIPLYPTPSRPGCELAEPVPNAVEAPGLVVTPARPPLGYYQLCRCSRTCSKWWRVACR